MKKIIALILLTSVISCSQTKNIKKETIVNSNNQVYWVNSSKVPCTGVTPMNCLQVQKNEVINPNQWEFFYDEINGFEYEEGFIYKIEVKEEQLPKNEVPADASSIRYTLIKVISKTAKKNNRLHDIWALKTLQGKPIDLGKSKRPQVEFNLNTMRFSGTDGCNQIFSQMKKVSATALDLGIVASSRMACEDMKIADAFHKQLNNVKTYQIKGLTLSLLDKNGIEILSFLKVD